MFIVLFCCYSGELSSFPTRRSSDLARMLGAIDRADTNAVCSPLSAQIVLTMAGMGAAGATRAQMEQTDRKSTRLNSSHVAISYAVFCLKKKYSRVNRK